MLGTAPGLQSSMWPVRPPRDYVAPVREDRGRSASSLDSRQQKCTNSPLRENQARRRRGRGFHRAMSGLRLGGGLRLITLTTSEASWEAGKIIQKSWRALLMRLRRRGWCTGYVRVVEFTKAGLPHYHVIIRGRYIPQSYLSRIWAAIHLSPIVDVRRVRGRVGAASYLAKYLGKDPYARYSWSWDWVWKGFVRDWRALISDGLSNGLKMVDIIDEWERILDRYRLWRFSTKAVG